MKTCFGKSRSYLSHCDKNLQYLRVNIIHVSKVMPASTNYSVVHFLSNVVAGVKTISELEAFTFTCLICLHPGQIAEKMMSIIVQAW